MTDAGAREDHTRSVAPPTLADKRRRGARLGTRLLAPLLFLLVGVAPARGQDVPPDEAWLTLDTPHFRLAFPERLEALGRRSALLAEQAWDALEAAFVAPPETTIELILTDHVDVSNGFARVAPRLQIVVHARPPVDGQALAYYDDWLHVVIVHELAHIFHLDRSGWIGRVGRGIFGRPPSGWPLFPGQAVPRWVTEGIATWFESAHTGTGRAEGSEFEMYLRTAALAGELESIDRTSGDSPVWPGGQRPYQYGSLFFEWLTLRHGTEALTDFVEAVAGLWVPYRLDAAARAAFGTSLREEWRLWTAWAEAEAHQWAAEVRERSSGLPQGELLTRGARHIGRARGSPSGELLAYYRADGRSDSRIVVQSRDGTERSIRTNGGGAFDWLPDGQLVFAQLETDGRWRMWSDLYVVSPDGGRPRRVSHGARLDHPAAVPGADAVVAIRSRGGHTDLVRVELADGRVEVIAPGSDSVHWTLPAVSPDGRLIAVSRWTPETTWEVVVLERVTGALRLRLDPRRAVALGASWSPDGDAVVFASDRSGVANLYRRDVEPGATAMGPLRQLTDVVTGVHLPAVAPDGGALHAALYTSRGWELARWPWPGTDREPVAPREADDPLPGVRIDPAALDRLEVSRYRTLATFRPTYWEPLVEGPVRAGGQRVAGPWVGASTTVTDMIGRHTLALAAQVGVERGLLEARGSWRWSGWGDPVPSFAAAQEWRVDGPLALTPAGTDSALVQTRSRRAEFSTALYRSRWRSNLSLMLTAGLIQEERTLLRPVDLRPHPTLALARPTATLRDLRIAAGLGTARRHALSLSEEEGVRLSVVARRRTHLALPDSLRGRVGADRSVDEVIGEAGAWTSFAGWGWTDHVLALRASVGVGGGPGSGSALYAVGDAAGRPETITGLDLFGGRNLTFPVRGFDRGARRGTRAWSASAEWRFPLALVRRAPGLLPTYLESLHGTVFADAGQAWSGARSPAGPILASVGAEMGVDTVLFFTASLRLRLGVAAPLSGGEGGRIYLRLGPSF